MNVTPDTSHRERRRTRGPLRRGSGAGRSRPSRRILTGNPMPNSLVDVISEKAEAVSALKLCFLLQAVLAMAALAQIGRNSPKSPQRLRRACAAVVTNGLIEVLPSRQLHS